MEISISEEYPDLEGVGRLGPLLLIIGSRERCIESRFRRLIAQHCAVEVAQQVFLDLGLLANPERRSVLAPVLELLLELESEGYRCFRLRLFRFFLSCLFCSFVCCLSHPSVLFRILFLGWCIGPSTANCSAGGYSSSSGLAVGLAVAISASRCREDYSGKYVVVRF